ncbi:MAG: hypothetical protein M5U08_18400 [Burkholderiales bacterium]|nr:hypothetical protein [Burkholderiales bacterium]
MAQRAAYRVVLVPAQELVQRDHDRAAPAGVGGVDRAGLRRGALVLEHELPSVLAQRDHHAVGGAVAGPRALDVGAVAPHAVGQPGELRQERALAVVDDLLHHALDRLGAVAADERKHPVARGDVAGKLGAEVERHRGRLARGAQVELLDVAPHLVALHDLGRRDQDPLVERVARARAEAARG